MREACYVLNKTFGSQIRLNSIFSEIFLDLFPFLKIKNVAGRNVDGTLKVDIL